MFSNKCFTITFGDVAENHIGMQKIGSKSETKSGKFSVSYLQELAEKLEDTENIDLSRFGIDASILIIRNGVSYLSCKADDIFKELEVLDWDKKYFDVRRSKILNKHARWNLCFADKEQSPDYENRKGRIVGFDKVTELHTLTKKVYESFVEPNPNIKLTELQVEGNSYYDITKTGIGFHGDAERTFTLGARFGETSPLVYRWYKDSEYTGESFIIQLKHGDMYIMSDKATGSDWKTRKVPTLRHAAGSNKYTLIDDKPKDITPKNTCKGLTKKGTACKIKVGLNQEYCRYHKIKI